MSLDTLGCWFSCRLRINDAFALQCTKCAGTDFDFDFFAINKEGFFLKVWFPHFVSFSLRKADVVSELFSFA